MNLVSVAEEIQHRVIHIFGRDMEGRRATNGGNSKLDFDPHFRDYVWFYEVSFTFCGYRPVVYRYFKFFNGDSGKGLGASHQTGWSGLVAYHILQSGVSCRLPKTPRSRNTFIFVAKSILINLFTSFSTSQCIASLLRCASKHLG
jgi:hypothetical protein